MPNLLMHQADAYVPRFKVENTLRFRRPFMLGERFHLASQNLCFLGSQTSTLLRPRFAYALLLRISGGNWRKGKRPVRVCEQLEQYSDQENRRACDGHQKMILK